MGGSTVVLVESAVQDLMWHFTRVRCPPEIIEHTRHRLQRLITEVTLADAVKAKEAEETTEDFCSGIIFDMVDDLLHSKIPFVEVENAQKELERVSYVNEILKLQIEEKDELDHLRQLSLHRKDDALLYTVHKYFEEVFLLRKERTKLTSLLRDSQKKVRKLDHLLSQTASPASGGLIHLDDTISTMSPNFNSTVNFLGSTTTYAGGNYNNNNNNNTRSRGHSRQNSGQQNFSVTSVKNMNNSYTSHPLNNNKMDSLAGGTFASIINLEKTTNNPNHHNQQQQHQISSAPQSPNTDTTTPQQFPLAADQNNNSKEPNSTTMAIFSYDELAVRMMLTDPDLATLKLRNLKLVKEMEQMRSEYRNSKRDMIFKYETKIKQMEAKLKFLLAEDDADDAEKKNRRAKIHLRQLRPLRASIKSVAEGFQKSSMAIRNVLAEVGDDMLTVRNTVFKCMDQVVANEEICSNQVSYAAEYVTSLVSNIGREDDELDTEEEKKKKLKQQAEEEKNKEMMKLSAEEENKDKTDADGDKKDENNNQENEEQQQQQQEEEEVYEKNPVIRARQHYEACLEVNPFDDPTTAKAKRYFRQHDITAFIRSAISSITQNTEQYNDLLRRLKLLSNYATKERSAIRMFEMSSFHDEILNKKRKEREQKKKSEAGGGEEGNNNGAEEENNEENKNANPTLIALSAASRVATDRRLYLHLFDIAHADPYKADHEYYGLDQRMTKEEEEEEEERDEQEQQPQEAENNNNNNNRTNLTDKNDEKKEDHHRDSSLQQGDHDDELNNNNEDNNNISRQRRQEQEQEPPLLSEFINQASQGPYKESIQSIMRLRFKRIAERCLRERMLENYDSFEYMVKLEEDDDPECKNFPPTGCFKNEDRYLRWKKYLKRIGKYRDDEYAKKIASLRERSKKIVTDCIAKLPSSLLVKIVMDLTFNPDNNTGDSSNNSSMNNVVSTSWYSPFSDFDLSHAPEHGEDWTSSSANNNKNRNMFGRRGRKNYYRKDDDEDQISNSSSVMSHGTENGIMDARNMHLRITCPNCKKSFVAALPATRMIGGKIAGYHFSRLSRHSDSNQKPNHPFLKKGGGSSLHLDKESSFSSVGTAAPPITSTQSDVISTSNIDPDTENNNNNNESSINNTNSILNDSTKKRVLFSPNVQEVHVEDMIPIAAESNRQGFFLPSVHSHHIESMLAQKQKSQERRRSSTGSLNSNSFMGGLNGSSLMDSILNSPRPKSILRGRGSSMMSSNANILTSNNNNSIDPSSGRSLEFMRKQAELMQKQKENSIAYQPWQEDNNNNNNTTSSASNTKFATINVKATASSTLTNIELDDENEEERLLLITRLKTKFGTDVDQILSNQPCILPTAGGNVSIEMSQQSLKVSAQGAAKQFVRRRYQEQLLVSQMMAMQIYLKKMKERDQREEKDLEELERELSIAKEYNFHQRGDSASSHDNGKQHQHQQRPSSSGQESSSSTVNNNNSNNNHQSGRSSVMTIASPSPPPRVNVNSTLESLTNLGLVKGLK